MSTRKPRSDAKLLNLPEVQQAQLCEWMLSGIPLHKVRELVETEFGVVVESLSPFSRFWSEVCSHAHLAQRSRASQMAGVIAEEASKRPGEFDAATIDAIKQRAFELAMRPGCEPSDVKSLFMLIQKSRDQDLKAQQIDLQRRRLDALEAQLQAVNAAVTSAKDGGLTPETLRKIEEAAKIL